MMFIPSAKPRRTSTCSLWSTLGGNCDNQPSVWDESSEQHNVLEPRIGKGLSSLKEAAWRTQRGVLALWRQCRLNARFNALARSTCIYSRPVTRESGSLVAGAAISVRSSLPLQLVNTRSSVRQPTMLIKIKNVQAAISVLRRKRGTVMRCIARSSSNATKGMVASNELYW